MRDEDIPTNQLINGLITSIRMKLGETPSEWVVRRLEREVQMRVFADFTDRGRGLDDLNIGAIRSSPQQHKQKSDLLSAAQAARLLDVSTETLRALRRVGCGPKYSTRAVRRISVIYSRHDLDEWMEGRGR